jgi:hypothetical protein
MPEISLDDPNIGAFINQGVAATVPKHVRVNPKMLKAGQDIAEILIEKGQNSPVRVREWLSTEFPII